VNFINAAGPAVWPVLLSDTQTPMKALATHVLREDDYVTDSGHHLVLVQSLISTKYKTPLFSSAPFSSVTRPRSFLEITARRDLPQNATTDPDDPAISRFCEAQTFVTVHTTARHYLILPLHFTKTKFNILPPTPASFKLPLSCLHLFRSQHACTTDARRSLSCKLKYVSFNAVLGTTGVTGRPGG